MEEDRRSRNKPIHIQHLILEKGGKTYIGKKCFFNKCFWEIGYPHATH
jgi:hypothetical protein